MGRIFNIQRFSLHDGRGIRTLVFLKGCPLRCAWCSNPEGISAAPELLFNRDGCLGEEACGACLPVCQTGAVEFAGDGKARIDRDRCNLCGDCLPACPAGALEVVGREAGAEEVMAEVDRDDGFYTRSGGGLTLSGGEPLLQVEFALELLGLARQRGLDTALETSGACAWEALEAMASRVDRLYYDIKCIDPEMHEHHTGVANRKVLSNFKRLRQGFPALDVVVRTPIVPGVNDNALEIGAIAEFILSCGGAGDYELLSFHACGESKYQRLGRSYPLAGAGAVMDDRMERLKEIASRVKGSGGTVRAASRSTA